MAQNAVGSRRAGPNCPLCRVHAPRKPLQCASRRSELGSRPPVQRIDLVALSFLPSSRHQLAAAVACADAADGLLETALEWLDHVDAASDLKRLAREALDTSRRLGLDYLALDEPGYPGLLSSIADPPIGLWVRGRLPERPGVAVIGSRASSSAALEIAHGLAGSLARHGSASSADWRAAATVARTRGPSTAVARPSRSSDVVWTRSILPSTGRSPMPLRRMAPSSPNFRRGRLRSRSTSRSETASSPASRARSSSWKQERRAGR